MNEEKKIGFFGPIPVRLVRECGFFPVFVPLLLEKYRSNYEEFLREGERLGFDLNSPLVARLAIPLVRAESIGRVLVVSPLDIREILTAFELINEVNFFLLRVSENIGDEFKKLLHYLGCENKLKMVNRMFDDRYGGDDEAADFISRYAPWIDFKTPCNGPRVGLLGEFPPAIAFLEDISSLFCIKFVEMIHLMEDGNFWKNPDLLLSPLSRSDWLNRMCYEKKLGGFIFLYYSLSSWQNYEIIYQKELKCPIIALEIKEGNGFGEREKLRLEAFKNNLKGG